MPKIGARELVYMGVDPGWSGGIAYVQGKSITVYVMPQHMSEIWQIINHRPWIVTEFAVIEQVTGYVGDGGNPGSSMFKFGSSYGALQMALTATRVSYETITPQRWQAGLGISKRAKSENKGDFKRRLKATAERLFPGFPFTLKTCDAVLIAEYCRRYREGRLR